jgi:hypothetical protein
MGQKGLAAIIGGFCGSRAAGREKEAAGRSRFASARLRSSIGVQRMSLPSRLTQVERTGDGRCAMPAPTGDELLPTITPLPGGGLQIGDGHSRATVIQHEVLSQHASTKPLRSFRKPAWTGSISREWSEQDNAAYPATRFKGIAPPNVEIGGQALPTLSR